MHACRRTPIEGNASVDLVQTTFTATGTPDRVAVHLEQVCRALTHPPVDRLADEAKVLTAERRSEGEGGWPLHRVRYGFTDLGVGDVVPPVFQHLSPEMVAHTWFVASNAVLGISGPLPESLRLPLRSAPARLGAGRPSVGRGTGRSPGRWSRLRAQSRAPTGGRLPDRSPHRRPPPGRLTETLRHEAGHTYVVERQLVPVAEGRSDLVVWAEPGEDVAVEAVVAMVGAVRLLSQATVDELLGLRVPAPEPSLLRGLTVSEDWSSRSGNGGPRWCGPRSSVSRESSSTTWSCSGAWGGHPSRTRLLPTGRPADGRRGGSCPGCAHLSRGHRRT